MRTIGLSGCICIAAVLVGCSKQSTSQSTTPARIETSSAEREAPETEADARKDSTKEEEKEPEQTYLEAWTVICDAQELSGVDPSLPTAEYHSAVVRWLVANLKNKQARLWFIQFGKVKENRKEFFEGEATKGGVSPCALSQMLFADEGTNGTGEPSTRQNSEGSAHSEKEATRAR